MVVFVFLVYCNDLIVCYVVFEVYFVVKFVFLFDVFWFDGSNRCGFFGGMFFGLSFFGGSFFGS